MFKLLPIKGAAAEIFNIVWRHARIAPVAGFEAQLAGHYSVNRHVEYPTSYVEA